MTDISLSDDLAGRIADRVQRTEFESVDAYAEFVLSEVVMRAERESDRTEAETASRDEVQGRLESLGYLEE